MAKILKEFEGSLDRGQIEKARLEECMFSGRAILTVESEKSGKHVTYQITRSSSLKEMWWVSCLKGQGSRNFVYIGTIFPRFGSYVLRVTKGSKVEYDDKAFQMMDWVLRNLRKRDSGKVKYFHEGYCLRCARRLTDPDSVKLGFGPECRKRIRG